MFSNIQAIPSFTSMPITIQNDSNEPNDSLIKEEYINLNESTENQLKKLKTSEADYQKLIINEHFKKVKDQFLNDIKELKRLASLYIGRKFESRIDVFYDNIENPSKDILCKQYFLYIETREHINYLVQALKGNQHQLKNNQDDQNSGENSARTNYLSNVLNECLEGIDLCPDGVHTRFTNAYHSMKLTENINLSAHLSIITKKMYIQFIYSFMAQMQLESETNFDEYMEIHHFSSFHNLYCLELDIPKLEDGFAPYEKNMDKKIKDDFKVAVNLFVNNCTKLRQITEDSSNRLEAIFKKYNISQIDSIPFEKLDEEIIEEINTDICKRLNLLMENNDSNKLDLWKFITENQDGTFCASNNYEILQAWIVKEFFKENLESQVFAKLTSNQEKPQYIGNMNDSFFWVSEGNESMIKGQNCVFDSDNYTSLQLHHLTSIDFSSWRPYSKSYALLTQALNQTKKTEDIVSFFLNPHVNKQLLKIPKAISETLSNMLTERIIHNESLKDKMSHLICKNFLKMHTEAYNNQSYLNWLSSFIFGPSLTVKDQMNWIINTPLFEPVLCKLYDDGIDISSITKSLNSLQITGFSAKSIKKVLKKEDCERLFKHAFKLEQAKTVNELLHSGLCDKVLDIENEDKENLLSFFSKNRIAQGLKYLQGKQKELDVNSSSIYDKKALHICARIGATECLKVLLEYENINTNAFDFDKDTPLLIAACFGHAECVKLLLECKGTDINALDKYGDTALILAAKEGWLECVKLLLESKGTDINALDKYGDTALILAAREGRLECVKELLKCEDMDINATNCYGKTALHEAVLFNNFECVNELLKQVNININLFSKKGNTALLMGAKNGYIECLQLLLEHDDIDVNAKDKEGFTARDLAIEHGHDECVDMLK